ncbi:MAG: Holliday junction branch migration protein RuvA [Desulfobulbus propionicus]|nr:MAG: Holliday junction branch migration protein RuvA [Desulfobulbus propionicus]
MIAFLSGVLRHKTPGAIILDVQGVGYEIFLSTRTYDALPATGEPCSLFILTSVREDAIALFGFEDQETKDIFILLTSISGVGPKLALAILSGIGRLELCAALRLKDINRLTTISGVGKKTAQRLCMELSEKVGGMGGGESEGVFIQVASTQQEGNVFQDAVSALVNLGYPQHTSWQAMRNVQKQHGDAINEMAVEELIRLSLQGLAQ